MIFSGRKSIVNVVKTIGLWFEQVFLFESSLHRRFSSFFRLYICICICVIFFLYFVIVVIVVKLKFFILFRVNFYDVYRILTILKASLQKFVFLLLEKRVYLQFTCSTNKYFNSFSLHLFVGKLQKTGLLLIKRCMYLY